LEKYRYADTANLLYDFVWHSFCDWYVELAKPDISGTDEARANLTRGIMGHVLDCCLRMLHPLTPFITEELWQKLRGKCKNIGDGETLVRASWPKCDESLCSSEVEEAFGTLIDITRSIRNMRANLGIAERKPVDVTISAADERSAEMISGNRDYLCGMACVGEMTVGVEAARPAPCAADVVRGTQVFVHMDEEGAAAEKAKLEKRLAETEKYLESIEKKLSNRNYVERAPEQVVQETREKCEELKEQRRIIAENIAALG
jgi:valyl-tRNA synthetase